MPLSDNKTERKKKVSAMTDSFMSGQRMPSKVNPPKQNVEVNKPRNNNNRIDNSSDGEVGDSFDANKNRYN
jgi:hypothetical protein